MSLRNTGAGMAVIQGWHPDTGELIADRPHAPPETITPQQRDLYSPRGRRGVLGGGAPRRERPDPRAVREAIEERQLFFIELLFTDQEGGQRANSRFLLAPREEGSQGSAFGDPPTGTSTAPIRAEERTAWVRLRTGRSFSGHSTRGQRGRRGVYDLMAPVPGRCSPRPGGWCRLGRTGSGVRLLPVRRGAIPAGRGQRAERAGRPDLLDRRFPRPPCAPPLPCLPGISSAGPMNQASTASLTR